MRQRNRAQGYREPELRAKPAAAHPYQDFTLSGLLGAQREQVSSGANIAASKFKKISCGLSRLKEALMAEWMRIVYGFVRIRTGAVLKRYIQGLTLLKRWYTACARERKLNETT